MNIFKTILAFLFLWSGVLNAQSLTKNKVSSFNIAWGTEYVSNYVKNPSARLTSNYNTVSNFNASIGSSFIEGATGWDLYATATGGYIDFDLHPFFDEDKVGNCTYTGYYNADGANYKAQIVDGSGVELVKLQLRDVTEWTPFSLVYPCGATGARKVRFAYTSTGTGAVFRAGKLTYKKYDDITVPDGASFYGAVTTPATATCSWTRTGGGSNSWGPFSAVAACPVATPTGKASAPATKVPAITFATLDPGEYLFIVEGRVQKSGAADDEVAFRFNDGTNIFGNASLYNGTVAASSTGFTGRFSNTTTRSNVTFTIEAITPTTTNTVSIPNSSSNTGFVIKVYKYPLNGTAYSNVIPARCINNPDCQNNFSAKVSSTGVVTDENYSFINGSAVVTSTSLFTITWDTSRFSVAPTCVAITTASGINGLIRLQGQATTSGVAFFTLNQNGGSSTSQALDFNILCSRAGTDVKPWGPIPLLSGMLSTNSTQSWKYESATIGGVANTSSCSSSPCTVHNPTTAGWISVTRSATGLYSVSFPAGTWTGDNFNCTFDTNNWGLSNFPTKCITLSRSATAISLQCASSSSGSPNNDATFVARCDGPR